MGERSMVSWAGRGILVAGLLASGACTTPPGAPGTTPALTSLRLNGSPEPLAQCAKTVLQKANECDNIDYGLGVTTQPADKTAKLTCYVVTPPAVAAGAMFGVIGVLVAAAVGEKRPADETNTVPPRYTALLTQLDEQTADAQFWVAENDPKETLDVLKAALTGCSAPAAAAPATAATAVPSAPVPAAEAPAKP